MKYKQIIIVTIVALMSLSVPCFSSDKQNNEISEIVDLNKNDTQEIECTKIIELSDSQFIKCKQEKEETKCSSTCNIRFLCSKEKFIYSYDINFDHAR